MNTHLVDTYVGQRPYVMVSLSHDALDGSLEVNSVDEARALRRGLVSAFFKVSASIRVLRRAARDHRDLARVEAYAEEADRG
ncbi:hypothetical protein PBI_PERCIVAL_31 [Microbacterium phage Percival]|uniref:Uncharacterized protein n=1 Tax=Microbacterium phage Percival TaxID=2201439 RepID=A0A2Z4Q7E7_9CAUD|nr:hypothetical protein PBI_PERCIVAL_31 [Microbacterium phage Percival]